MNQGGGAHVDSLFQSLSTGNPYRTVPPSKIWLLSIMGPLAQDMNEYFPWIHTRREDQEMETPEPGRISGAYNLNSQKLREEIAVNSN